MGLHDRLKTSNGSGGTATELLGSPSYEAAPNPAAQDPYAELKTRIHHACIATLGAELFKREATGDLNERVTRAVTEQLVAAGRLLDIPVHDHVIIGRGRYTSFAEAGLL